MESSSFDLVAASLRADAGDLKSFVEALATKLSESFPGQVRVERSGAFFRSAKPVRRIVITLGDERFGLDHENGVIGCFRSTLARGIALKNEQLELGPWIDSLSETLVGQAEATENGRNALARLLA